MKSFNTQTVAKTGFTKKQSIWIVWHTCHCYSFIDWVWHSISRRNHSTSGGHTTSGV